VSTTTHVRAAQARSARLTASLRNSGPRLPVAVGAAVFLISIGSGVPLGSFSWYIRTLVLPAVVVTAWIVDRGARSIDRIRFSPALIVMLVWMTVASAWSPSDVDVVIEATFLLLMISLTAHFGAAVFGGERLLEVLVACTVIILVIVAVHTIVDPEAAFSLYQGEAGFGGSSGLRSIFYHKNSLGIMLTFGVALTPAIRHSGRRLGYGIALGVLLVLCNSSTAWVASACIVVSWFFVRQAAAARRAESRGGVFLLMCVALIGLGAAVAGRTLILHLLGREPTLTGRDIIWRYSWHAATDRPLFGFGTAGFWDHLGGPAYPIQRIAGFEVTSSHQGLIDIMLDYGLIGVALFVVVLSTTIALLARRIALGDGGAVTLVSFGLLAAVLIGSLTEGNLIGPGLQVIALCSGLMLNVAADPSSSLDGRPNNLLSRP
jgi:exopolysaccharide production protein ExoQ